MTQNDAPYALVLWDDRGSQYVWVRPHYDAALQVLRAWFAIKLVEFSEIRSDVIENCPDPSSMAYEQIAEWITYNGLGWDIMLLPVNTPADPLRDFHENRLRQYPVSEQERMKRNVTRAVRWVCGWSPIEHYEELSIDQLPPL